MAFKQNICNHLGWLLLYLMLPMTAGAEIFIGHARHRPPGMVVDGKTVSGPIFELIQTALERHGHQVSWLNVPWARSINMAEHGGELDLLPRHSMSLERYEFLLPILYGYREREVYYFAKKGRNLSVENFSDLEGLRVGQVRGSFYSAQHATADFFQRIEVNRIDQLISMLERGRIDVVVSSEAQGSFEQFVNNEQLQRLGYAEVFLHGRYFSIPKHSPLAIHFDVINSEILSMRKKNEVSSIFAKYQLSPPIQRFSELDSEPLSSAP